MGIFIILFFAAIALYLTVRIGIAVGRKAPTLVSMMLGGSAIMAAFYWLFIWKLSNYESVGSGVVIFWVFAKAFGVVCLVAVGALLFGASTRSDLPPNA